MSVRAQRISAFEALDEAVSSKPFTYVRPAAKVKPHYVPPGKGAAKLSNAAQRAKVVEALGTLEHENLVSLPMLKKYYAEAYGESNVRNLMRATRAMVDDFIVDHPVPSRFGLTYLGDRLADALDESLAQFERAYKIAREDFEKAADEADAEAEAEIKAANEAKAKARAKAAAAKAARAKRTAEKEAKPTKKVSKAAPAKKTKPTKK